MILIIDHYDSFTYNLFQAFSCLYDDVRVIRHDEIDLEGILAMKPKGIVLSPGPGRPEETGVSLEVIRRLGPTIPILGVCLGHQAIGLVYGAEVIASPEIMHGKESLIFHRRQNLFRSMPLPFKAGRYHSLAVRGGDLVIDAKTSDGTIMAFHHPVHPVFGVQFHPESILTPEGKTVLKNFVELCR